MIEYNLEKHKPKIVYDVNGVRKYLCKVRKMLIHITPEETVRQSFLSYLISEIKIPITKAKIGKKKKKVFSHFFSIKLRPKNIIFPV